MVAQLCHLEGKGYQTGGMSTCSEERLSARKTRASEVRHGRGGKLGKQFLADFDGSTEHVAELLGLAR